MQPLRYVIKIKGACGLMVPVQEKCLDAMEKKRCLAIWSMQDDKLEEEEKS